MCFKPFKPSTAATLAEKFIREARDKYQRFTRKLYDNSIADGIDIAADISANLINCRDSLSTTLSKVCGNNVDSDYKSYCTTIEGIKNSADHGMKMIDEIVANKNSLTANAFDSYFDEIFNTLKSNVEKLIKEKVTNKKQTGCYFMKYQKGMSKFDQRLMSLVRQYLQQYLIAGQAGFFDEIEGFRKQIVDASEACFKTDDVATCLNDFVRNFRIDFSYFLWC